MIDHTKKTSFFSPVYLMTRCAFIQDLNEEIDVECLTVLGRLFQTVAA